MLISLCVGVDSRWRVWLDPVVWCGYDCWVVGSTPIPAVMTRIGPFPPSVTAWFGYTQSLDEAS